jgi:DNA-binding protein HU-beta
MTASAGCWGRSAAAQTNKRNRACALSIQRGGWVLMSSQITHRENTTMNKAQLVDAITATMKVSHDRAVSKADVNAFFESLADISKDVLEMGDEVTLPGLGKLTVTQRAERTGRNPKTGEAITIPAAKAPKFTAAKALKDALNSKA